MRIAVVGGDERAGRRDWPPGFEMSFFRAQKWGAGDLKRLANSLNNGKVDVVITLVRWSAHSSSEVVKKHAKCRVITWDRGIGELIRQLPDLVAGVARAA